jgi:PAS domain S-box-containing protein
VSLDALNLQLSSARRRLSMLQRLAQTPGNGNRVLNQALQELETALEELQVAQEHLTEQNTVLSETCRRLDAERTRYWQLFDSSPDAYVVTGEGLLIEEANRAAAQLLNISQRFLVGKPLSVFVSQDRGQLLADAQQLLSAGGHGHWILRIRPRERAPLTVEAKAAATTDSPKTLRWMLRPMSAETRPMTSENRPVPSKAAVNTPEDGLSVS